MLFLTITVCDIKNKQKHVILNYNNPCELSELSLMQKGGINLFFRYYTSAFFFITRIDRRI